MARQDDGDNRRRRASDRRSGHDRRLLILRRELVSPPWTEQRTQFLTRYLFWFLGLAYYNLNPASQTVPSLFVVNAVFAAYGLLNTAFALHARRKPDVPARWRLAMVIDILFVSFCFVADHGASVPPAFMAYLAVILGNGMRYSMRFFREAVAASFVACPAALYLRYWGDLELANLGTAFVILFGGIIILYSYVLMRRVEEGRQRLEREGRVDALTGLLNRRGLHEKAEVLFTALERSDKRLVVLFADLNKFKSINDRLGHHTGDKVLSQLAVLLASAVRGSDILARYGGDEFVLILPESDLERGRLLAERLQENVARWVRENDVDLSLSIGIAEAPRHGRDLTTVMENVDRAMYRGKGQPGRIECADELAAEGIRPAPEVS